MLKRQQFSTNEIYPSLNRASNGKKYFATLAIIALMGLIHSCTSTGNRNSNNMETGYKKGTYGYDLAFLSGFKISTIELKNNNGRTSVLIAPGLQGRVMTSTMEGLDGMSFGWINYNLFESGKINNQFNAFGGEERLWLGPEGGPFSIYFKKDTEQVFANWVVPKELDTEPFELTEHTPSSVNFKKGFNLINASGSDIQVEIERSVNLLNSLSAEEFLGIKLNNGLSFVAYESANTLINNGKTEWTKESGALSIWMLSMFNPSPEGVVFIPFKKGSETESGKIVSDDYFGKVPSDRLIVKDGILFFKTDGKHRSKIGISPERALPYCGSYDPANRILTILWYSAPEKPGVYVNSKWGEQISPFTGDVVNSYNDGPVEDGSVMGPFYEIESSSPAAFLKPGEKITHTQRIFHITGSESQLSLITKNLFNVTIDEIITAF